MLTVQHRLRKPLRKNPETADKRRILVREGFRDRDVVLNVVLLPGRCQHRDNITPGRDKGFAGNSGLVTNSKEILNATLAEAMEDLAACKPLCIHWCVGPSAKPRVLDPNAALHLASSCAGAYTYCAAPLRVALYWHKANS